MIRKKNYKVTTRSMLLALPKTLLLLALLLSGSLQSFAQTYITVNDGNATDASTWKDNIVPPSFVNNSNPSETTITIDHNVYFNNDYTYPNNLTSFTINAGKVFVTKVFKMTGGGTLVLNGVIICFEMIHTAGAVIEGTGTIIADQIKLGGSTISGSIKQIQGVYIWTGAADNNWNHVNNWQRGGATATTVPGTTSLAAIAPSPSNQPVISTSDVTIGAMFIAISQSLTVSAGRVLTVDSTAIYNKGILNLKSSASGTACLKIYKTPTLTSGAIINVERYIPDEINGDDWHIISSPVTGSGTMQNFASTQEINPGTTDYDLAPYDEQVGTNNFGDWGPYILQSGSDYFSAGLGYAMRRKLSVTNNYVTFTGNGINSGTVGSISITRAANGWNALGNPYTSPIGIVAFLTTNSAQLEGTPYNGVYIYDPSIGTYTGVTSGNIALGQGFIVKSKTGGGSISFTSAMQNTNAATFKNAEIPMPTAHLKVTGGDFRYITTVKFGNEMSNNLDNFQDIGIFKGNPDIALYTRMPGDATYDLQDQSLPLPGETALRIPVGFDYAPGGEVTFSLTTENFSEDLQVYLEDTNNGKITLLSGGNLSYTTSLPVKTSGAGRFKLLVQKSSTVGAVVNKTQNEFSVYTSTREIVINGSADSNTSFDLYSIDGKCWHKSKASNKSINRINGAGYPAGIYLLKISKKGTVQTSKLVLTGN